VVVAAAVATQGCDNWPLYAHLPDPASERSEVPTTEMTEDGSVPEGTPQSLGSFAQPARFRVAGSADECGFDASGSGPSWPQHPVDSDGDGLSESAREGTGWYSGDVDLFTVTAEADLRLSVRLSWTLAPDGGQNAPYRPDAPEEAWASQSDLDVFVFESSEGGELTAISHDEGVSRNSPEQIAPSLVLRGGGALVVGVACHHAVASEYQLDVLAQGL